MLYQKELKVGFFEKLLNSIKAQIFKWSNSYLLVETELVKKKLANILNYVDGKIFVIGNSYSPNFKKNIIEYETKLFPANDVFQILIPGSYYPHKNLERIIFSLKKLKVHFSEGHIQHLKLVFTIPEQSEGWNKLFGLAQENGVEGLIENSGICRKCKVCRTILEK